MQLPVDAFAVRVAGRHLYDRVSHGYVHLGAGRDSATFDRVVRAYESAYAVPSQLAATESLDAADARGRLGADFIDDVATAIERTFDIHVIQADDVAGDCAIQVAGRRVILVGTTPNWFFRNWSIAHELGHIFRGDLDDVTTVPAKTVPAKTVPAKTVPAKTVPTKTVPTKTVPAKAASPRALERAANAFAAELLLPHALLTAVDWLGIGQPELADFVWRSGVSTRALAQRLDSLKLEVAPGVRRLLGLRTVALVQRGNILSAEPLLRQLRVAQAGAVRFPLDLLEAHRIGLAAGGMDASSLEWMRGSSTAR
jgi:Zn-dependent peptidase ImmA (M78 family)